MVKEILKFLGLVSLVALMVFFAGAAINFDMSAKITDPGRAGGFIILQAITVGAACIYMNKTWPTKKESKDEDETTRQQNPQR